MNTLTEYTDMELLSELVSRNTGRPLPKKTSYGAPGVIMDIGIGKDHTASIVIFDEAKRRLGELVSVLPSASKEVVMTIPLSELKEARGLIREALSPRVYFDDDMDTMKAERDKKREDSLTDLLLLIERQLSAFPCCDDD